MFQIEVNILAVIAAAIISVVTGIFWYSPALFGKVWTQSIGKPIEELKKSNKIKIYILNIAATLLMAYVLAIFIGYLNITTVAGGLQIGFWIWLGFVIPVNAGAYLWESRPLKLYLINNGYHLVAMLLMGAVLAIWA